MNLLKSFFVFGIILFFIAPTMAHYNKKNDFLTKTTSMAALDSNKTIVYLLAGLGLDPAVFQRLEIQADEIHYLRWLDPQKKETLTAYAQRMADSIQTTSDSLVLIGHSFGGVLMQEISKLVPAKKIILISSIKAKKEKDAGMNFWMRAFPLHRLVTQKMVIGTFKSWGKQHGYDSPEAKEVFLNAAKQHSNYYFRWATSEICKWKSENVTTPIVHIHGTKDKTFPYRKVTAPVLTIEGGSHLMVFNQADKVSLLINKALEE